MRAPLSWIRDFTPVEAPVGDIADALNQLGLEVEAIDEPGPRDRRRGRRAHPRRRCRTPTPIASGSPTSTPATAPVRVVCGAPNIEAGMVVPFAQVGAHLPGDFKIERRKIRGPGVGRACCARRSELGLGDDHAGILELPADAPLGTDVREVLGLDDVVFDLSITPNRPDAMGIVGVARELAAHFGLPLTVAAPDAGPIVDRAAGRDGRRRGARPLPALRRDGRRRHDGGVARLDEAPARARRHAPDQQRRRRHQLRDARTLPPAARVRPRPARGPRASSCASPSRARRWRRSTACERELTADDLLICDGERVAQGIAGVMGGAAAEVSDATTEILLESAYFEASGIAKTSKRLGLRSEASARFERGVDPNDVARGRGARDGAARRGRGRAQPAAGAIDVYPQPIEPARITVRTERVNRLLGHRRSPTTTSRRCLTPLGIEIDGGDRDRAHVASRPRARDRPRRGGRAPHRARADRAHRCRRARRRSAALTAVQRERRAGRRRARGRRLRRGVHAAAARAGRPRARRACRPTRSSRSRTRCAPRSRSCGPRCCPGLLRAVAHNAAHGNPDVSLFELGHVFAPPRAGRDAAGRAAPSRGACVRASIVRAPVRARPRRRRSTT